MTAIVVPSNDGATAETSVASGGIAATVNGFRKVLVGIGFRVNRIGENRDEENDIVGRDFLSLKRPARESVGEKLKVVDELMIM